MYRRNRPAELTRGDAVVLLAGSPVLIHSPHPPAVCVARMASVVDPEGGRWIGLQNLFGTLPVVGLVTPTAVRLRKRTDIHNSFQTFLTATVRPDGPGTVLSGRVGMHPVLRRLVLAWLVACGLASAGAAGALLLAVLRGRGSDASLLLAVPPLLAVGTGLIVATGRLLAWGEAAFLTRYVSDTLRAETRGPSGGRRSETTPCLPSGTSSPSPRMSGSNSTP